MFAARDVISDRSLSSLLRLDVCCSDHLAPLFGFISDELTEVGGRLGERSGPQVGQARLDVGMRKTRIDISVQLVDDLGRCVPGYGNAVPGARLIASRNLLTVGRSGSASEGIEVVTASARSLPVLM